MKVKDLKHRKLKRAIKKQLKNISECDYDRISPVIRDIEYNTLLEFGLIDIIKSFHQVKMTKNECIALFAFYYYDDLIVLIDKDLGFTNKIFADLEFIDYSKEIKPTKEIVTVKNTTKIVINYPLPEFITNSFLKLTNQPVTLRYIYNDHDIIE